MSGGIDPRTEAFGLEGHVVVMDDEFHRLEQGIVYVNGGEIASVVPTEAPAPVGLEDAPVVSTGGTIYPGLIDLHNHLSYNALPLWDVPQRFDNRDRWSGGAMQLTYRKTISGPMTVLGRTPGMIEAVVRYVEAKCLLAGVTTSQGIALFSNQGAQRFYRGLVRNVETSRIDGMPPALTRIADVEAEDAAAFLHRLSSSTCLLLHLSEGTDEAAHEHFESLRLGEQEWAITPALAGIHCVALERADFDVMAERDASMVWSPLSNLLLYGATARIDEARAAGARIGLGADWSPSGSKSLLGELKAARAFDHDRDVFTDRELVAAATREAARILRWESKLGTIEAGKRADLLVLTGREGDPYGRLLRAMETSVRLVVIDGIPRCGGVELMSGFELGTTERWSVGESERVLHLLDDTADPLVAAMTLGAAAERLVDGVGRLPQLAEELETMEAVGAPTGALEPRWMLLLDHEEPLGLDQRPHLPGPDGSPTAELTPDLAAASVPLSELLLPIELDAATVADDPGFVGRLERQVNLPPDVAEALRELY